jgi:hypothetical protein
MGRIVAVLVVFVAGCGRLGFAPPSGGDDVEVPADAPPDTASPDAVDARVCPAAMQSSIDATNGGSHVTNLVGVTTSAGLALSYIAPGGVVFGTTYDMKQQVAQTVTDKNLAGGPAQSLGVLVQGGRVLIAWSNGNSTELERLDDSLNVVGTPSSMSFTSIEVPLAIGGAGAELAFAYQSCGCGEISASQIDIDGKVTGTTKVIVADAETPTGGAIISAQNGFLATWIADSPARSVRGELLDASLTVVGAPRTLSGITTMAVRSVRSAWSPETSTYLIAWEEGGAVRAVIADATLAPAGSPFTIAASGTSPRVTSDAQGFWIAWTDGTTATHLAMALIDKTGASTQIPVIGSGGTVIDYYLVTVGGTAQLVWIERGGSGGGNLWVAPACNAK